MGIITNQRIQRAASYMGVPVADLVPLLNPLEDWRIDGILFLIEQDPYIENSICRFQAPQWVFTHLQPVTAQLIQAFLIPEPLPPPPPPPIPRRVIKNPRPLV